VELKSGFKVGPWEARPLTGELIGGGEPTRLEPKVMEVLVALAQQPGEVVEREELLRRVWGNRAAVSDEPLTRCIAELRRAFGDSRQAPTYIQTIPKRGYRLVCPVTLLQPSISSPGAANDGGPVTTGASPQLPTQAQSSMPTLPQRRLWRFAWLVASLAAAIPLLISLVLPGRDREATGPAPLMAANALAVLSFLDGNVSAGNYFGEGVAEDILIRLSGVPGLRVIRRDSSFAPRAQGDDYKSIGARLGAAHLVDGSVSRDGDQVHIDIQLIDPQRRDPIWRRHYDRPLIKLFALEDEIANTIVSLLRQDSAGGSPITTPPPTRDVEAWYQFQRGRHDLSRRDAKWVQAAIESFERATELDPEYGEAYVELAKAKVLLPSYEGFVLPQDSLDEAERILATPQARTPALDTRRQIVRALIAQAKHNWIEAGPALQLAYQRAPDDSDLLVWYSEFMGATGHAEESVDLARRASTPDPLSPVVNHRLSVALMWINQNEEAAKYLERAEENGWNELANLDSYVVLKLRQRDFEAVRHVLKPFLERISEVKWVDPFLTALASPDDAKLHAIAVERLETAGRRHDIPLKYLYGTWVYLKEPDRAIDAALRLVKNSGEEFKPEFLFSREAASVRKSPRFGELVQALELDRYWDQFGWPPMCKKMPNETIECH
jgi:DNA-binding winged helix-turn-helix (wHTH) protein/TolB-like protein/tetratricopeptide (TPR) repeat protein